MAVNETALAWISFGLLAAGNLWPGSVVFQYVQIKSQDQELVSQIQENLLAQHGRTIRDEAERRYQQPAPWGSLMLAIFGAGGFQSWQLAVASFVLFIVAVELEGWVDYVRPIVNQHHARQRQIQRNHETNQAFKQRASFEAPPEEDDAFFSSKAQQQRREPPPQQDRKPPPKQETPYGFDKRHPKDAALWAVVDDPNATAGERQAAFSRILKNEAERKQGKEPKPASKSGITPLLGSDRK